MTTCSGMHHEVFNCGFREQYYFYTIGMKKYLHQDMHDGHPEKEIVKMIATDYPDVCTVVGNVLAQFNRIWCQSNDIVGSQYLCTRHIYFPHAHVEEAPF